MVGELHIVPTGHDAFLERQWIRGQEIELQVYEEMARQSTVSQVPIQNSSMKMY